MNDNKTIAIITVFTNEYKNMNKVFFWIDFVIILNITVGTGIQIKCR